MENIRKQKRQIVKMSEQTKSEVLSAIGELCKTKGISQAELSRLLGLKTPQQFNNLTRRDEVSVGYLEKIANVCGCEVEIKFIPKKEC